MGPLSTAPGSEVQRPLATVVIGGLTIIEKTKSRAGNPLLMDLPVIGALFRNETERENKRDLLIMVTPHIVRD